MWPIDTDVTHSMVCVPMCWSHGCTVQNGCIDLDAVFGHLNHVGPRNDVSDTSQDRMNRFAEKNAVRNVINVHCTALAAHISLHKV